MKIHEKLEKSRNYFNQENIPKSKKLLLEVENELQEIVTSVYHSQIQANLGCLMIDLGAFTRDKELITRGKIYTEDLVKKGPEDGISVGQYYNLANGYIALWNLESKENLKNGKINENYLNAKKYFRIALDLAKKSTHPIDPKLLAQININLGNCLCSVGRDVEALSFYDQALKFDKSLGMALGNKAITLQYLSFLASGHTHLFLLESRRLYEEALKKPIPEDARRTFQKGYDTVNSFIQRHQSLVLENHINSEPISRFHQFSRDFCIKYQLYLTPTTFIGKESVLVYGDPMFISSMIESLDNEYIVNRHITFLNQIKQDFVLARYFLIQSNYQSTVVDTIDQDVILYDPLDYSIYNAYVQLLMLSLKSTMDTFDKIAQFLREYCAVNNISAKKTYFRTIWTKDRSQNMMRSEFSSRKNKFLLALFDLSLDLQKNGYYQYIYERRNAITHRFLIVHEMMTPNEQTNVTSRISREDLFKISITALQLLRAVVIYLILFVDSEEKKKHDPNKRYGQLPLTRVLRDYQWRPLDGDNN
ncbi:MAG: LA2681 family HEPN domain-containing protein [Methanoregulaceae archaeon]|jgi:tetratricopeptide (TPR) repeat protein